MISILVVDHDHVQRTTARTHLERAGYAVTCAKSGSEALQLARTARFDLVVSNLVMDGLDLCRRFREDKSLGALPVVLVSERALTDSDRERAHRLGALELIQRSDDFKRELTWIRAAVQQVLGR